MAGLSPGRRDPDPKRPFGRDRQYRRRGPPDPGRRPGAGPEREAPLLIDAATLTGAARVALGTDLPALFSPDDTLAATSSGPAPIWASPFGACRSTGLPRPSEEQRRRPFQTGSKPFAGAITAALFLERFVEPGTSWAHLDIFAWNDESRPGGRAAARRRAFEPSSPPSSTASRASTHEPARSPETPGPCRLQLSHAISTRWADNDIYGHVNNVIYYSYFDTAIAGLLIGEGGFEPWQSPVIGLAVETGCRFNSSIAYPDRVTAGVGIAHLGNSSVRYVIGIFRNDEETAAAEGHFVHVFVDRATQRPATIPPGIRAALERHSIAG
jgi:acyl-CoA thioester hydrolase